MLFEVKDILILPLFSSCLEDSLPLDFALMSSLE